MNQWINYKSECSVGRKYHVTVRSSRELRETQLTAIHNLVWSLSFNYFCFNCHLCDWKEFFNYKYHTFCSILTKSTTPSGKRCTSFVKIFNYKVYTFLSISFYFKASWYDPVISRKMQMGNADGRKTCWQSRDKAPAPAQFLSRSGGCLCTSHQWSISEVSAPDTRQYALRLIKTQFSVFLWAGVWPYQSRNTSRF